MDVDQWRDHLLFALTVEELPGTAVEALSARAKSEFLGVPAISTEPLRPYKEDGRTRPKRLPENVGLIRCNPASTPRRR